ncbi:uncharacterized protein LOC103971073 isoform X4 [Musa acuminata AAA Group]|uniref:uncharacterized protein LOC103971073 isoform X4 n=2 Tax=Musa acuminata AAA Group TaxID=214697 RepID=UPI0031DEC0E5
MELELNGSFCMQLPSQLSFMALIEGSFLLLLLIISWAGADARSLVNFDVMVDGNDKLCTLCESFVAQATQYIGENKTQTEIIEMLHQACSNVDPFEEQCVMLVDFYASLFFAEISKMHPEVFCTKFNLCEEMVSVNLPKNDDSWLSCSLCHDVVANVLVKLKDPDIQFEVIKMLLEGCNGVQHHVNECKKLVLHYGPLILENGENFLEITDVCAAIHSCKTSQVEFIGTASAEQASLIEE